jgi:acetylornithine deacetylase/succinyl-diaminopimelate desuccinylase-like protein
VTSPTSDLLQNLIRNACVNDGTEASGEESRNCNTLRTLFNDCAADVHVHSKVDGRENLVVRLEGSDKDAPSVMLLGHTDVVPATASDWDFDPFGGEIVDGYVRGRGAVDMLNLTSAMAIAMSNFIASGAAPKGDIVFAAVADEEAGGQYGAEFLVSDYPELVNTDFVITESGGLQMPHNDVTYVPVMVGEKGVHWAHLDIEGTPSHGSKPYGTDNAVVTAAAIVDRLHSYSPSATFSSHWETFLNAMGVDAELVEKLAHKDSVDEALARMESDQASLIHACCHTTISPNVIHGGSKVNTVADHVRLSVDMRSLPGMTTKDVEAILDDILGEYRTKVDISYTQHEESSESPTDTFLWDVLADTSRSLIGECELFPMIAPYGTDARFFRRNGAVAYGFGLFSPAISFNEHISMFHGRNEKVDLESLNLTTQMFENVLRRFAE